MFTEGYGTNDEHITGVNGLGRQPLSGAAIYFESCHWSVPGRGNLIRVFGFGDSRCRGRG
jgi:hypothetical protein